MQAGLGLANVRAAFGQFGRQANGELLLRRRQFAALQQLGLQAARRFGGEQAEGVDQVIAPRFQAWQARLDRGDLGTGLGHIQARGDTFGLAVFGQLQTVLGDLEVVAGHIDGVLHGAQLDVVAGGFRKQCQQHAAAVVLGHFDRGIGSLDLAPHTAPQVQFPAGHQVALPEVEGFLARLAGRVTQAFGTVARAAVASVHVHRRYFVGSHGAAQGAALQQAGTGHLQVEVALGNALDQGTQAGIVEALPPAQFQRFGLRLAGRRLALQRRPLLRCLAVRALEVWAQGAASHQHGQQQRAQA
ncbi:hypothetical protein D3C80_288480 [compost metagenome]